VQLAELEPVVRERAITLAMQRQEIPGWSLVHQDGHSYVDFHRVIELGLRCPVAKLSEFLAVLAAQAGSISERKYLALCESAGVLPDPEAVKTTGASVHLRRNSPR
jgi:hypothetical protein